MALTLATALCASLLALATADLQPPKPPTIEGFTTVSNLDTVYPMDSDKGNSAIGLFDPQYIVTKKATSHKKCAAACAKNEDCVGFAYVVVETKVTKGSSGSEDVKVPAKKRCRLMTSLEAVQETFDVDGVFTYVDGDMYIKKTAMECEEGEYFGYHYTSGSIMFDLGCHAFAQMGEDCGYSEGERLVNMTPPEDFEGPNRDTICVADEGIKCLPFYNEGAYEAGKFTCQDPENPSMGVQE